MQRETRCTLAKKGASGGKSQEAAGRRSALLLEGDGVRGIRGTAGEGVSVRRTGRETTIDTAAQDFATTIVRRMVST